MLTCSGYFLRRSMNSRQVEITRALARKPSSFISTLQNRKKAAPPTVLPGSVGTRSSAVQCRCAACKPRLLHDSMFAVLDLGGNNGELGSYVPITQPFRFPMVHLPPSISLRRPGFDNADSHANPLL